MSELSPEVIDDLKARFGPIFATTSGGQRFVCRTISRTEAVALGVEADVLTPDMEDRVFKAAVIEPSPTDEYFATVAAGTVTQVARRILERSGLHSKKGIVEALDKARARKNIYHDINGVILAAFPDLVNIDLNALPVDRLMDLLVQAEISLTVHQAIAIGGFQPVRFADKGEMADPNSGPVYQESGAKDKGTGVAENGMYAQNEEVAAKLKQAFAEAQAAGLFNMRR